MASRLASWDIWIVIAGSHSYITSLSLYIYSWITMITYVGDRDTGIPIETAGFSKLDYI
jgi:hypothetical protein